MHAGAVKWIDIHSDAELQYWCTYMVCTSSKVYMVQVLNSSTSWWGINYPAQGIFVLLCTPTLLTSPPCPCNWDELQGTGDKPAKERYESGAGSPLYRPYNFGV